MRVAARSCSTFDSLRLQFGGNLLGPATYLSMMLLPLVVYDGDVLVWLQCVSLEVILHLRPETLAKARTSIRNVFNYM